MVRYYWESLFDPDPHPCIGCGVIIQHPKAKRCPKCRREREREYAEIKRRGRKERGECIQCGKVPIFKAGRCELHWHRNREYQGKYRKRRYREENPWKFIPCEICGRTIRKNTYMKFCRPCSVESVMQKDRSRYWEKKNLGLCKCGRKPEQGRVLCIKCRVRGSEVGKKIFKRRKEQGLCTQCGKVPKGKTLQCEECRLDKKKKDIKREIVKG